MAQVAVGDNPHNQRFTYTSFPRSLYYSSYKNITDSEKPFYGNVMYDKRVVRGNTWALRRMAHEALLADEQEDRNRLKQKRNSIRQQIQAKLEAHKKTTLPNVPKRQQPKGYSSKRGVRTKDDFKRTDNSSRSDSNEKSPSEISYDNKLNADKNDMQISDNLIQEDNDDKLMQTLDESAQRRNESDLINANDQIDNEEMNAERESILKRLENSLMKLTEASEMVDNKIRDKNSELELNNTVLLDSDNVANKNVLDTVAEETENDFSSSELKDGDKTLLSNDIGINENMTNDEFLKLLLSKSDSELYPLPQIESTNFTDDSLLSRKEFINEQLTDNQIRWLLKDKDDSYEQQITEALSMIVDSALREAEKEIQYEMEIEQLRSENEELKKEKENIFANFDEALLAANKFAEDQKLILINEFENLEKEKMKFSSRQISWDFVNNEILPICMNKLIENGYMGVDEVELEKIQKNRVTFEDDEREKAIINFNDDFIPWLNGEVWANVAHSTLSRMLDDAIDLQNSFCRRNAKNFIRSALDSNF